MQYLPYINIFVLSAVAALTITAAVSDLREFRIPNWLTAAVALLYPVHVLAAPVQVDWAMALALAAAVFGAGMIFFMCGWMGGGDVKLMAALALFAGPQYIVDYLFITAVAGGVMAVLMTTRIKTTIALAFDAAGRSVWRDKLLTRELPYGVAIAAGGVVVAARLLVA